MFKAALSGEVDAVINFWHFQAKAKAAGMTEIISTQVAAESLGLDPTTPLPRGAGQRPCGGFKASQRAARLRCGRMGKSTWTYEAQRRRPV